MRRLIIACIAALAITALGGATVTAAPTAHAAKKCKKKKGKKCPKIQHGIGPAGPQGPAGQNGTNGQNGAPGAPGTPATTHGTLTLSNFVTTPGGPLFLHNPSNTSVKQTPDGIEFGPYADGGAAGGSVEYTGLNGQPLTAVQSLAYFARYVADNDTGGVGVPYLRIFLGGDAHDAIFSPNTQPPNPDIAQGPFHTWAASAGVWRYDDDGGSGGAGTYGVNGAPFTTLKADHGSEIISGIYISAGNSAGTNLAALLRQWKINATTYDFSL